MEITHKAILYFVSSLIVVLAWTEVAEVTANSWVGSKYQIECTMCSACDNPCNNPSPPPPSPPPPSPPPPSTPSSSNCPPPPSPPSSGNYYYSPPPPYQPNTYSYPPPPGGVIGGLVPPPYRNFPAPPPPNPIVPYFPFYYYSPPPPGLSSSVKLSACSAVYYTITLLLSLLCFF